jgi:CYTH domain-containing protein
MCTVSDIDSKELGMEIERKFLLAELPPPESLPEPTGIVQGYVDTGVSGTEVRLRRKGNVCFLTLKSGSGLQRQESEVELTTAQFDVLWPSTEGRRVEKDRYELPFQNHLIELDIFHGALKGLVVAEVEFGSVEESQRFVPPDCFGREVTGNPRYQNRLLALKGKP